MRSLSPLLVLIMFLALLHSCEHDPFPAPPPGMDNDTTDNPVDTTGPNDTTQAGKPCDPDTAYFDRDILPILTANCAMSGCHTNASAQDGVILTSYTSVMQTADVRPGDLDGSDLYEMITEEDREDQMPPPPNATLTQEQISLIAKWIMQGAQDLTCDECDLSDISFQQDIEPIFKFNCQSCHGNSNPSGGQSLVGYTNIKDAITGGEVIGRINHQPGFDPMPPSGIQLDACKLDKIDAWVAAGLPNN